MGHTYKMVTIVGTSDESYKHAIENGVQEASKSLRNLGWFEVQEMRGRIKAGSVAEYQVKLQLGFRVDAD